MDNLTWPYENINSPYAVALKKKREKANRLKKNLILLGVLAAFLIFFSAFPYRFGLTMGESMMPTMKSNHLFIMDINPYIKSSPSKYDVVVFEHQGVTMVKRVIGVSSDIIWLLHTKNGSDVIPPNSVEKYRNLITELRLQAKITPYIVPAGSVFVLGDNLSNSEDSRDYGPVPIKEIKGKVVYTEDWKLLNYFRRSEA